MLMCTAHLRHCVLLKLINSNFWKHLNHAATLFTFLLYFLFKFLFVFSTPVKSPLS